MMIQDLPAILMAAIRNGTWITPNAPKLRILARATRNANALSDEPWAAISLLAWQARSDLPGAQHRLDAGNAGDQ